MSLLRQGKAEVLTIYVGEADQWQGTSVYVALVHFFRAQGCAGATVTRALAGYGAGGRLHHEGGWHLASDTPVMIQVVDQPERLRRLLPQVQEMVPGGLITLHETTVLKYTHARRQGLPTRLPVRQIMETAVTAVAPEAPVARVIEILLEASFRTLPVVDEHYHLLGIIGTRDLIDAGVLPVRRGIIRAARTLGDQAAEAVASSLEQCRQEKRQAQDIMNRQIRRIAPTQTVREAAQIMLETGLRSLPVVETDGRLIGMVSRMNLLQVVVTSPLMSPQASTPTQPLRRTGALEQAARRGLPVAAFLHSDVPTVEEETPVAEVIDHLVSSPYKRVLVVDADRHILGVISDVDILLNMQAPARPGWFTTLANLARGKQERIPTSTLQTASGKARMARDVMNSNVVRVVANATVEEAIELMLRTGRKMLPVLDTQDRLLGIVGRSDLLHLLIEG
jgi:CBS-domain-containing membrane protein